MVWNLNKATSTVGVVMEYRELIIECMRAIIANPNYQFRQEDMKKYFDKLNQTYDPKMKYELTVLEAQRYADALMALEE